LTGEALELGGVDDVEPQRAGVLSALDEGDLHVGDLDDVPVLEGLLLDPNSVDQRAVEGAEILDQVLRVHPREQGVAARAVRVFDDDVVLGRTADADVFRVPDDDPGPLGTLHPQQRPDGACSHCSPLVSPVSAREASGRSAGSRRKCSS